MISKYVQVLPVDESYCVIIWKRDNQSVSKTVCYSPREYEDAVVRFHTPGDFYNGYDGFYIEYNEERSEICLN